MDLRNGYALAESIADLVRLLVSSCIPCVTKSPALSLNRPVRAGGEHSRRVQRCGGFTSGSSGRTNWRARRGDPAALEVAETSLLLIELVCEPLRIQKTPLD